MSSAEGTDDAGFGEAQLRQQFLEINQAGMRGDQNETTLEGLQALLELSNRMRCPQISFACATAISLNYSGQRDWEQSIAWAKTALNQAEEMKDQVRTSDAAKAVAINMRDQIKDTKNTTRTAFTELIDFLNTWAIKDGELGFFDNQIDKYGILANVETLIPSRIHGSDSRDAAKYSLNWLDMASELVSHLPEEEQMAAAAEIQFKASDSYLILDEFTTAGYCLETARLLFAQAGRTREAKKAQQKLALTQLLAVEQAQLDGSINRDQTGAKLNESLDNLHEVEDALLNSGFRFQLVNCHLAQAWIWERAFQLGQSEALPNALSELEKAESIQNKIRSDMSLRKDEDNMKHKSAMVAQTAQIYELGVRLNLATENFGDAWNWVQKGKARAFHDLLSIEENASYETLSIQGDEEAKELLRKESDLLQLFESTSPERRFSIRQEIAALRSKMSHCAGLEDLLLYRGIKSIATSRLKEMFAHWQDVVCVDWITVEGKIWMFTVRPGEEPYACELRLSPHEVSLWIDSNLTAEYMRQPRANERMRTIDTLVAPLAHKTKTGELLIFCPGALLSALPLHALELDGQTILERNLVTYAPSLSVLNHCLSRRSAKKSSLRMAAIFGNPTCDRSAAESSSRELAERIGVEPHIGKQATKAAFLTAVRNASVFHYHGHATYASTSPLLSALILNPGETQSPEAITARDILGLKLSIALFVMIACESAQQKVSAGEEPTGLLAMLMVAGVNSIIGTLWKCSDAAGKEFTRELYSSLLGQFNADADDSGAAIWLNIAKAVQQAALAIRKSRPAPYFWALFVLHGNWQCLVAK